MIDITNLDLIKFVKKVYGLSRPLGLGFFHFIPNDELTDHEAKQLIDMKRQPCIISMDYVRGRSCKMHVWKENDRLEISEDWLDHTKEQLNELLEYSKKE